MKDGATKSCAQGKGKSGNASAKVPKNVISVMSILVLFN